MPSCAKKMGPGCVTARAIIIVSSGAPGTSKRSSLKVAVWASATLGQAKHAATAPKPHTYRVKEGPLRCAFIVLAEGTPTTRPADKSLTHP
jgi:hypothetical protein